MFDVIVDSEILGVRDRAKAGNLDSMVLLGTYIQKGMHTRKDKNLAMQIFDYVLTQRDRIPFPETLWNVLNQKAYLHHARGEEAIIDELYTEVVQHMVALPPEQWDHERMMGALRWLKERKALKESATIE